MRAPIIAAMVWAFRVYLEPLSLASCYALTGTFETWCARAWRLRRASRFWASWVRVADRAFRSFEHRHCERSWRLYWVVLA